MNYRKLIKYKFEDSPSFDIDFKILAKLNIDVTDRDYLTFISEQSNGGFFFNKALHLYGSCEGSGYHDIIDVNNQIQIEYKEMVKNVICFGQDILANQFCFDKENIIFFNIETGDKKVIAKNFKEWVDVILKNSNYFTGLPLLSKWGEINLNERLCPKKPFVIGGEYDTENLYSEKFPQYLSTNANIARQIHYLPEGSDIKIKLID